MVYDENTSFGNNNYPSLQAEVSHDEAKIFSFAGNNYPKRVSCFLRKFRSKLSLQVHRKTIFASNVSRNFKKKVASVTFKVYRGIFSWNSSAVTEFCIVNFYIGSCVFITQNVFKLRKTLKTK